MSATKRITVLVTASEKRRIAKRAKAAGLSRGEFLRRAVDCFPLSEDEVLEGMIAEMNETTTRASATIDKALTFIEASNKRIARMERKARTVT